MFIIILCLILTLLTLSTTSSSTLHRRTPIGPPAPALPAMDQVAQQQLQAILGNHAAIGNSHHLSQNHQATSNEHAARSGLAAAAAAANQNPNSPSSSTTSSSLAASLSRSQSHASTRHDKAARSWASVTQQHENQFQNMQGAHDLGPVDDSRAIAASQRAIKAEGRARRDSVLADGAVRSAQRRGRHLALAAVGQAAAARQGSAAAATETEMHKGLADQALRVVAGRDRGPMLARKRRL